MLTKRRCSWRSRDAIYRNEQGVVLTTSLIVMAVLSLMGATAILTTITDTQIASNLKNHAQAFYYAEAGIQYTLARLPDLIADGSLSLTGSTASEKLDLEESITAPANFSFDPIDTFIRVGNSKTYQFQVTGRAGTSRVTLRVDFRRVGSSVTYGLFGNQMVDLKGSNAVMSYDSSVTPYPPYPPSPSGGDVGSNGTFSVSNDTHIYGSVSLGESGTYTVIDGGTPTVTGGWPPDDVKPVDPDPLGAIDGNLAADFAAFSTNNDNADPTKASPPISGNQINLSIGQNLTLKAGNYYLQSITLNASSTLTIDTSSGEVNIYLVGPLTAKKFSTINYINSTSIPVSPTGFYIYSNASEPITFENYGDIRGMIYAPYARVEVNNRGVSGDPVAYGLIWADTSVLYQVGQFYFDTALKQKFLSTIFSITSWKEP